MNQFVEWNWQKLKKYTGIYRCLDEITNLVIRVQLKEIADDHQLGESKTTELESKTFRWQQKVHGKFEREFYKDESNCVTDLDKKYHREIVRLTDNDGILYTYVDEDEFCIEEDFHNAAALNRQMSEFRRPENEEEEEGGGKADYDFVEYLCDAMENPYHDEVFQHMFIMVDFGEYVENTWIKSEYVVCTLKYSEARNLLLIYPDFTMYEPYTLQVEGDLTRRCIYFIENTSDSISPEVYAKETETSAKIASYRAKQRARAVGFDFDQPPKNKLVVHLFCEILSGENFEHDDIYVQYTIDLPDHWQCADQTHLKGTTCSSHTKDQNNWAHFGYPFEVALECNLENIEVLQLPYIYFEVVSKDTWNRYRTEGLAYKVLPVSKPGMYQYQLQCLRILPRKLHGNMKRFFIGDYRNYDDVTWLGIPKDHEGPVINKHGVDTIGTGQIDIKMNVVHHSQALAADGRGEAETRGGREARIFQRLSASALVKSVEEVLAAFKRARKNMMEAKKNV